MDTETVNTVLFHNSLEDSINMIKNMLEAISPEEFNEVMHSFMKEFIDDYVSWSNYSWWQKPFKWVHNNFKINPMIWEYSEKALELPNIPCASEQQTQNRSKAVFLIIVMSCCDQWEWIENAEVNMPGGQWIFKYNTSRTRALERP